MNVPNFSQPRQLHRKEPVQEPRVEEADAEEHEIGQVALDEPEAFQQRGDPEPDDPRVETHTHTTERLRADALNQVRANRDADEDARQDVGNELGTFKRIQPGVVVGHSREQ